jgi:hypothetical protein
MKAFLIFHFISTVFLGLLFPCLIVAWVVLALSVVLLVASRCVGGGKFRKSHASLYNFVLYGIVPFLIFLFFRDVVVAVVFCVAVLFNFLSFFNIGVEE